MAQEHSPLPKRELDSESALEGKSYELETQREKISQRFYSEYMNLVFGTPARSGDKREHCLLNAINPPEGSTPEDVGLFAVSFMNKLFFIQFIEDGGIAPHHLLKDTWRKFEKRKEAPKTFYKSCLEPLFFHIFYNPVHEKGQNIQERFSSKIPSLNGGLFRPVVKNEAEYDIEDDILDIIITDFIEKYPFTVSGERGLDPDILGNVFEKTINYLSGRGTNAQKARGAYYTPEDVITYLLRRTLHPYLLNQIKNVYTQRGWTESDLRYYTSLEEFLSTLPGTKEDRRAALAIVDAVCVLDPACGSGHFLTSALRELFSIKRRLLDGIEEGYDPCQVKMGIMRRNLVGVDIEAPAVEVTKLRLWLMLMEEIEVENEDLRALPDIECNILQGDSLLGPVDEQTLKEGGFDIVIGNPPYVEVPERGRTPFNQYHTRECGNTHAYFYERSLRLVKRGGFCGFIVPLSSISTDRMRDLQELLIRESSRLWISNYDDRPGRLFGGLEHCRSSIVISQKKKEDGNTQVFTTKYHRWNSEKRNSLFENISYVEATDFIREGSIPKIGTEVEKSILKKISRERKLTHFIREGDERIWYHNAPQYWIRALDFIPFFWSEREGVKVSSHLVELHIIPEHKKVVAAVLNSSLFYWFFVIYSNGRDLVSREIENFPLSADEMPRDIRRKIGKTFDDLMEDYQKNAKRKVCHYKTTGRVEYDQFRPGLSKKIIDDIDRILAEYYGFTDEEAAFIVNFDKEFRLKDLN